MKNMKIDEMKDFEANLNCKIMFFEVSEGHNSNNYCTALRNNVALYKGHSSVIVYFRVPIL